MDAALLSALQNAARAMALGQGHVVEQVAAWTQVEHVCSQLAPVMADLMVSPETIPNGPIGEVTFDKRPDGTVQVTRYAANFGHAKFPVTCSLFLPEGK